MVFLFAALSLTGCDNGTTGGGDTPIVDPCAGGHDSGEPFATAATCTTAGATGTRCTRCQTVLSSTTIPALNHDYQWVSTAIANETKDGIDTEVCSHDSSHTRNTRTIYATGTAGIKFGAAQALDSSWYYYVQTGSVLTGSSIDLFIPRYVLNTGTNLYYSVTEIKADAFKNNTNIKSVVIPDTVTTIGESVFGGCTNLESITLPFCGTTPTGGYFYHIFGGTYGAIPASLKKVTITGGGHVGFDQCSNLETILVPNATDIRYNSFNGCTSLETLAIPVIGITGASNQMEKVFGAIFGTTSTVSAGGAQPAGTTTMQYTNGTYDFWYKIPVSLKTVIFTGTTIPGYAFNKCINIKSIVIPASVTSIGAHAFESCAALDTIYYGGTNEQFYNDFLPNGGQANLINALPSGISANDCFFYSANTPTNATYKYWRFIDGVPVAW